MTNPNASLYQPLGGDDGLAAAVDDLLPRLHDRLVHGQLRVANLHAVPRRPIGALEGDEG